jgi:hypothetical protein
VQLGFLGVVVAVFPRSITAEERIADADDDAVALVPLKRSNSKKGRNGLRLVLNPNKGCYREGNWKKERGCAKKRGRAGKTC